MTTLVIPERDIRSQGPGPVLRVCWRQWRAERKLARRGVHFRTTALADIAAAYAAMTRAEFNAINGRQDWANWRTIPRALSGHVPNRSLRVLDLGCGAGSSTEVLAFYCPAGSWITGYEVAGPLLDFAARREYRQRHGALQEVDFVAQPIHETLRDADGDPVPGGSVDVVSSSGVVGFHLDEETVGPLLAELDRVLRPAGVALIDVGPTLGARALRELAAGAGFRCLGRYRSWLGDPTGQLALKRAHCT
jgi:SAM-dependent methyltransferase